MLQLSVACCLWHFLSTTAYPLYFQELKIFERPGSLCRKAGQHDKHEQTTNKTHNTSLHTPSTFISRERRPRDLQLGSNSTTFPLSLSVSLSRTHEPPHTDIMGVAKRTRKFAQVRLRKFIGLSISTTRAAWLTQLVQVKRIIGKS